jgi:hypothetical protein
MPRGGFRPGSGRKKKQTVDEQKNRRSVVLEVFNEAEWRACLIAWLKQAKGGNIALLYPLLPYLLGNPKQEIDVTIRERAKEMAEADELDAAELIRLAEELVGVH